MQIIERDGGHAVSYVTGPTHNFLFLRLGKGPAVPFEVKVLPCAGASHHDKELTPEDVLPAICAGISRANEELGTRIFAEYAEIVKDDSRQPAVYEFIALQTARHAIRN